MWDDFGLRNHFTGSVQAQDQQNYAVYFMVQLSLKPCSLYPQKNMSLDHM